MIEELSRDQLALVISLVEQEADDSRKADPVFSERLRVIAARLRATHDFSQENPVKRASIVIDSSGRNDITYISGADAHNVIEKREPRGLFIVPEDAGFTGIDNRTGEAYTEHFRHEKVALAWLLDELMDTDAAHELDSSLEGGDDRG